MTRYYDSKGNEVEISVSGFRDELEIDECYYVDESLGEVPDEEVDYILDAFAGELDFQGMERAIMQAEDAYDAARGH